MLFIFVVINCGALGYRCELAALRNGHFFEKQLQLSKTVFEFFQFLKYFYSKMLKHAVSIYLNEFLVILSSIQVQLLKILDPFTNNLLFCDNLSSSFDGRREGFGVPAKKSNNKMGRYREQRFKMNKFEFKSIHPH